jgi:hypothetical protein
LSIEQDFADDVVALAKYMHERYEHWAEKFGWWTQEKTRVSFDELPQANKNTMIKLASEVFNWFFENTDAGI